MSNIQLQQSFEQTGKALERLRIMMVKPIDPDRGNIDATIQRFEFTIELFWKLLKRILSSKGIEVLYPKDVLKAAYAGGLISQDQMWLAMLRDRNLTSHTYNENLADEIYANIKIYYPVLKESFDHLKSIQIDL